MTCRLCLSDTKHLLEIFSDVLLESDIRGKISKYFAFNIEQTDSLSKFICLDCLEKLEDFNTFSNQVQENQERLTKTNITNFTISFEQVTLPQECLILQVIPTTANETVVVDNVDTKTDQISILENSPASCISTNNLVSEILNPPLSATRPNIRLISEDEDEDDDDDNSCSNCSDNDDDDGDDDDRENRKSFHPSCSEGEDYSDEENSTRSEQTALEISEEPKEHTQIIIAKISEFPKEFIKEDKLVIKGRRLLKFISRFYKLKCEYCPEDVFFRKLTHLLDHCSKVHSAPGFVQCCGTKYYKLRGMSLHMARHIQPDAFRCPECNKMMTCPKILRYHIQNHLPESKRPLGCKQCPRRFSYSSALIAHQVNHLPVDQRNLHICDECGKRFSSSGRLSKHINATHAAPYHQFVCHECGKQFSCKGNLSYHLTTHQQIPQVQCELCAKWLKNKLCLRKHMQQHSSIRHFCTKCNYSATNLQSLRNHERVQHTNHKPFACAECGREFKIKTTLLNHMVQHTGIRKYACEFCKRLFASSGNYYAHRKRMHPQELAELNQRKDEELRIKREIALSQKQSLGA